MAENNTTDNNDDKILTSKIIGAEKVIKKRLKKKPQAKSTKSKSKSKSTSNQDNDNKDHDDTKRPKKEVKSYWRLDEEIKAELGQVTHYVSNYEPPKFYVASPRFNKILVGYAGKRTIFDMEGEPIGEGDALRFSTPVIDAIPISGIKYDNGIRTDKRYKITFKTNTDHTFTCQPNTVEDIIVELRGRGLIAKRLTAEEALRGILNSMEKDNEIEITNEVEEAGFYLDPKDRNKIVCYGMKFEQPTREQIKDTCDFIDLLVEKYQKKTANDQIRDRRALPVTMLKWSICAPFDWVMKEFDRWLQWIQLGGWYSVAKNKLAKIALAPWRLHNKRLHTISFNTANTEARLGRALSQSTFPININEVHKLSDPKNENLVNMIKNAVDEKNSRGRYGIKNRNFEDIMALAAAILTGNGLPPRDPAYRSKVRTIILTIEDMYDRNSKEAKEFSDWLNRDIHLLGKLGDYTANYIMNRPEMIKNKDWTEIGTEVLKSFYQEAGLATPDWIDLMVENEQASESQDEVRLLMRRYFVNLINDACNRYRPPLDKDNHVKGEFGINPYLSMKGKLIACCEIHLISFIQYGFHKDEKVFFITSDIMAELQKNHLSDLVGSHKGLADHLGFQHKNAKIGSDKVKEQAKVIVVTEKQMEEFLDYAIIDIEEKAETGKTGSENDNKGDGDKPTTPPNDHSNNMTAATPIMDKKKK